MTPTALKGAVRAFTSTVVTVEAGTAINGEVGPLFCG